MRRSIAWLGGGLLLVLGALLLARPAPDPDAPAVPMEPMNERATSEPVGGEPGPHSLPGPPASLRGTTPPGGLEAAPDGRFQPGPAALRLFDYFLSATGEEPEGAIRARIVAEIERTLAPAPAAEAIALLDAYLAHRHDLRALIEGGAAPEGLERRWQWVRERRRAHFGAELAAQLFGEEERVVALDLERRRILADAELEPAQRAAALADIEARLPERVRAARAQAIAPTDTRKGVARLRAAGADEAEIFALREERLGREAAERLAAMDGEREEWDARVAAYRRERAAIADRHGDDPAARAAALDALRARHFAGPELLRIEALDAGER